MLMRVVITPFDASLEAIAATIRTLESLPPPAGFVYTDTSRGQIYGVANDWEFVRFACEQQGYAAKVEALDPPPLTHEQRLAARKHEAEQAANRARTLARNALSPELARAILRGRRG